MYALLTEIRKIAAVDRARAEEILERGPSVIDQAESDQAWPGIARQVGGLVGGGLIGALLAAKLGPKIPHVKSMPPGWQKAVGAGAGGFVGGAIAENANPFIQASTERKYLGAEFPDIRGQEQTVRHALSAPSDVNKLVGHVGSVAGASAMHLAAKALAKKRGGMGAIASRLAQKIKGGSSVASAARIATSVIVPFLPALAGYIAGGRIAPKLVNNALGDRLHEDAIKRVTGENDPRLRNAEILGNVIGGAGAVAAPAVSPFGWVGRFGALESIGKLPTYGRAGGSLARAIVNKPADSITGDQPAEEE